jgi:hypothetical protein
MPQAYASVSLTVTIRKNYLYSPLSVGDDVLDAVVSGFFGVSSPPSPKVALRSIVKTKLEEYSERVLSRPDSRFIPFAVTEFGTISGHANAF